MFIHTSSGGRAPVIKDNYIEYLNIKLKKNYYSKKWKNLLLTHVCGGSTRTAGVALPPQFSEYLRIHVWFYHFLWVLKFFFYSKKENFLYIYSCIGFLFYRTPEKNALKSTKKYARLFFMRQIQNVIIRLEK